MLGRRLLPGIGMRLLLRISVMLWVLLLLFGVLMMGLSWHGSGSLKPMIRLCVVLWFR